MGSICYGLISLISRFLCWEVDDYIDYYNIIVWGKTIRISIYLDNLINLYGEIGTYVVQLVFKIKQQSVYTHFMVVMCCLLPWWILLTTEYGYLLMVIIACNLNINGY